jgi:hypothetical protein
MDDGAVMAACFLAVTCVLLENVNAIVVLRNFGGNGKAYNARAYDDNVRRFREHHLTESASNHEYYY